jgi:hypothetical protein
LPGKTKEHHKNPSVMGFVTERPERERERERGLNFPDIKQKL